MEGDVQSPVPFPVSASPFPCGSQGREERWDEGLASAGHWAVGVGISQWPRHLGMDRRCFARVHHLRIATVGEVPSPETPAAVPAVLLTFYLHYFYEMLPGVMRSFHHHPPALGMHSGERCLI